jgi:hypothetical protein
MSKTTTITSTASAIQTVPMLRSKWAGRFIWAAVIQGLIALVATVMIVEPWTFFGIKSYFSPSMVIAGNGAGTWLFTGYISYLVVGVIGVGVTALFYFYIEGIRGKQYRGIANLLSWGHFVLMNIGVAASMLLMMYGGYLGGWAAAPVAVGGLGYTDGQIHVQYLSHFVDPIGAFVLVACLGALLGGLGYVLSERTPRALPPSSTSPA